jgi:hypothetical protein
MELLRDLSMEAGKPKISAKPAALGLLGEPGSPQSLVDRRTYHPAVAAACLDAPTVCFNAPVAEVDLPSGTDAIAR